MATGLWNTLELLADTHPPAAVMAEWRQLAGADFAALNRFLCPTQRLAQNYPCLAERDCGCRHEVETTELFSLCQCEFGGCEAVKLTPAEIIIHELDMPQFGDAVGGALGFEPADGAGVTTAAPKVWPAGMHTETRSPVFLALCPGETELLKNLQVFASARNEPFILLAPTAGPRSEAVNALLQRQRCAFIPLASCLAPNGAGFRVTNSIRPILDRFAAGLAMARKPAKEPTPSARPAFGSHGRLQWSNDFKEIRLGGVLYNLLTRKKARYCIQYLVQKEAFDESSARLLEKEIDPFVRKNSKMPPLPDSSRDNLRIQHYFNGTGKNLHQLCAELIKSAGNGRFYLHTQ